MEDKYIGDIYMITSIDYNILNYLKTHNIKDNDFLFACKYVLAKRDANLVKIDKYYIDIDALKTPYDIKNICELICSGSDSNNLLKNDVYNPYVGQLFVKNLRKRESKNLKYINTQN